MCYQHDVICFKGVNCVAWYDIHDVDISTKLVLVVHVGYGLLVSCCYMYAGGSTIAGIELIMQWNAPSKVVFFCSTSRPSSMLTVLY